MHVLHEFIEGLRPRKRDEIRTGVDQGALFSDSSPPPPGYINFGVGGYIDTVLTITINGVSISIILPASTTGIGIDIGVGITTISTHHQIIIIPNSIAGPGVGIYVYIYIRNSHTGGLEPGLGF